MINNVENSCAANIFMETTIILGFFHFLWELKSAKFDYLLII